MKAEELDDLKIYSSVLDDDLTRISVLSSLLYAQIRDTERHVGNFKGYVDENALKNAGKNH